MTVAEASRKRAGGRGCGWGGNSRGGGWGRLVEEAQRLAVAAECHSAWVDTFSFQSPDFYRKLGYSVFGELPDYPAGRTRFFLSKRLDG